MDKVELRTQLQDKVTEIEYIQHLAERQQQQIEHLEEEMQQQRDRLQEKRDQLQHKEVELQQQRDQVQQLKEQLQQQNMLLQQKDAELERKDEELQKYLHSDQVYRNYSIEKGQIIFFNTYRTEVINRSYHIDGSARLKLLLEKAIFISRKEFLKKWKTPCFRECNVVNPIIAFFHPTTSFSGSLPQNLVGNSCVFGGVPQCLEQQPEAGGDVPLPPLQIDFSTPFCLFIFFSFLCFYILSLLPFSILSLLLFLIPHSLSTISSVQFCVLLR